MYPFVYTCIFTPHTSPKRHPLYSPFIGPYKTHYYQDGDGWMDASKSRKTNFFSPSFKQVNIIKGFCIFGKDEFFNADVSNRPKEQYHSNHMFAGNKAGHLSQPKDGLHGEQHDMSITLKLIKKINESLSSLKIKWSSSYDVLFTVPRYFQHCSDVQDLLVP